MYYTISINDLIIAEKVESHKEVSQVINDAIVRMKLQSNPTTNNIISNWLSRGVKPNKWNFVKVFKENLII